MTQSLITRTRRHARISYDVRELIGPSCGVGIAGFEVAQYQPYPAGVGMRLSAPSLDTSPPEGFTEVVQVADGLHGVIVDWGAGVQDAGRGVWEETGGEGYGWLYVGAQGDGRLQIEGFGTARKQGPACCITLAPPGSTFVWGNQLSGGRRGIHIAFHGRYLKRKYPSVLCLHELQHWLSDGEIQLRDLDIPVSPIMLTLTTGLLNLPLQGELRHQFVCATVEQLLCLALDGLVRIEKQLSLPIQFTAREITAVRQVRTLLDQHLASPPGIQDLARRFGLNRTKLRSAFRELFGIGIWDYIHEQRMRSAYEQLARGDKSVSEIASSVGYNHLSNFTTAFRRHFGRPPSQVLGSGT
jgi:AraC-like DNA-binding protein